MNMIDKFGALCLASAFRCNECKALIKMINLGYFYKLDVSTNERLLKALDNHIKEEHPDRYEALIIKVYSNW